MNKRSNQNHNMLIGKRSESSSSTTSSSSSSIVAIGDKPIKWEMQPSEMLVQKRADKSESPAPDSPPQNQIRAARLDIAINSPATFGKEMSLFWANHLKWMHSIWHKITCGFLRLAWLVCFWIKIIYKTMSWTYTWIYNCAWGPLIFYHGVTNHARELLFFHHILHSVICIYKLL